MEIEENKTKGIFWPFPTSVPTGRRASGKDEELLAKEEAALRKQSQKKELAVLLRN